ncbi:hypothetical protein H0H93_003190, partial [Arthromyces matolae]
LLCTAYTGIVMTSNKHNKKPKGVSRSVDHVRISKNAFGVVTRTKIRLNQTALARERMLSQERMSSLDAAARGCDDDNDDDDAKLKHDGMQGSERREDVDVNVRPGGGEDVDENPKSSTGL